VSQIQESVAKALRFLYAPSNVEKQQEVGPLANSFGALVNKFVTEPATRLSAPEFAEEQASKIDPFMTGMTKALKGTRVFHGALEPLFDPLLEKEAEKLVLQRSGGVKPSQEVFEEAVGKEYSRLERPFKHFDPMKTGSGAGGNLYGEGIYLTEHPKIGLAYADAGGVVRTHNIPPQAKILDIEVKEGGKFAEAVVRADVEESPRYAQYLEQFRTFINKKNPTIRDVLDAMVYDRPDTIGPTIRKLGYDGISFEAGRVGGLPPGVPKGTRNYVIYNYDVINNPRKWAVEKGFKK
jgi:hypothetical protein